MLNERNIILAGHVRLHDLAMVGVSRTMAVVSVFTDRFSI